MVKRKVISHECYCRDCDWIWYSSSVESCCPFCAKVVIAKLCINKVEEVKDEVTD